MSFHWLLLFCSILFFAFSAVAAVASCPNGMIPSYTNSDFCYSYQTGGKDFMAAESFCNENFGGHLASIHDIFDNMAISDQAAITFSNTSSSNFWIGLNENSGDWSWTDGTPSNFMDWKMPHTFSPNGTVCTSMMVQGGNWMEANCTEEKPFVCLTILETPTTTVPNICEHGWTPFERSCYKAFDNATWAEGERYCESNGAHLVDIESEGENSFVTDLAYYPGLNRCDPTKQAWVGRNSQKSGLGGDDNSCTYITIRACSLHDITGQINHANCDLTLAKFVCKKPSF